jgi:DNA sulfur modification protein DndE
MQMLDAWTNVFADPGTRITGDKAGNYAITGPSWKGTLPSGVKQLKSPTHMVFILGRTFCTGTKEDYEQVHKLQDQYTLTPLSSFGKPYTPPAGKVDSSVDLKTSVRDQVNRLDAPTFFKLFASLLKDNPPAKADASMVAKMAKIGIVPGKDFVMPHSNTPIGKGLAQAPKLGLAKIMAYQKEAAAMVNGWAITLRTGVYGTNYLMRALTAAIGLGANLPQDAIYPFTSVDANNHPLTGAGKYVLHFTKEEIPPVKGFWSLTMYNPDYFLVANPINRYSINSSTHLKYNKDGSLDVYVQHDSPGKNKEMNWLPAPTGPFILMLRLYWPDESALNGTWKPPAVQKAH